jgi:hypothetical protein
MAEERGDIAGISGESINPFEYRNSQGLEANVISILRDLSESGNLFPEGFLERLRDCEEAQREAFIKMKEQGLFPKELSHVPDSLRLEFLEKFGLVNALARKK